MSESCFLCRFVRLDYPFLENKRDEDPERTAQFHSSGNYGKCCRHAPDRDPSGNINTARWPVVYLTEWCGDFERYIPSAVAQDDAQAPTRRPETDPT